ncbi:MAG: AtpZ/AtpI family protein [Planctomycetota bacterium]
MSNSGSRREDAETRIGWRMAGLGLEVGTTVMAGAGLGWLFDRWRGSGTTGVLVGGLLGIAIGLTALIRGSLKLNRLLDETARRRRESNDDSHPAP